MKRLAAGTKFGGAVRCIFPLGCPLSQSRLIVADTTARLHVLALSPDLGIMR